MDFGRIRKQRWTFYNQSELLNVVRALRAVEGRMQEVAEGSGHEADPHELRVPEKQAV